MNILEDISPFCRTTGTLFWTFGDVYPGFQSQEGSPHYVLCHLRVMDSSDSPDDLWMANVTAEHL